jgi:hypothetical protein
MSAGVGYAKVMPGRDCPLRDIESFAENLFEPSKFL